MTPAEMLERLKRVRWAVVSYIDRYHLRQQAVADLDEVIASLKAEAERPTALYLSELSQWRWFGKQIRQRNLTVAEMISRAEELDRREPAPPAELKVDPPDKGVEVVFGDARPRNEPPAEEPVCADPTLPHQGSKALCRQCGQPIAPSGVDGGTWWHVRLAPTKEKP